MKIAVIGSGIAGLTAAETLHAAHEIDVYEKDDRIGGHVHTHRVERDGRVYDIDSGFIVFNDWTYPRFKELLNRHGVASQASTMSFSVRDEATGLEYSGTSLNTLFAQRRNLLSPRFLGMLRDILRFNRQAPRLLSEPGGELPLAEVLARGRYGEAFVRQYIVPMGAAIWSTDPDSMLAFPARFFVRFLSNHGMLSVDDRPMWRTILGGAARYVDCLSSGFRDRIRTRTPVERIERCAAGVMVKPCGSEVIRYDAVFVACHSDEALALLGDATDAEREVLGALPYQRNDAVLHCDLRLLPRSRRAWAAWNYHVLPHGDGPVALTYNMNVLQGLDAPETFLVTLNRADAVDPSKVIARMTYHHPLFTPAGIAAQARQGELNATSGTFFCGAYWRNGFHEDGVVSAQQALAQFEAWATRRDRQAA